MEGGRRPSPPPWRGTLAGIKRLFLAGPLVCAYRFLLRRGVRRVPVNVRVNLPVMFHLPRFRLLHRFSFACSAFRFFHTFSRSASTAHFFGGFDICPSLVAYYVVKHPPHMLPT